MKMLTRISFAVALAVGLCSVGCEKSPPLKSPPAAGGQEDHGHDHDGGDHGHDDHGHGDHGHGDHGHDDHGHGHHAAEGPHGGQIIELSHDDTYHAELTDDHSTDTVTVYLLGEDLKQAKTEQKSVTLVLTAEGKTESFELAGDGSMFSASSPLMLELLEANGAKGKLRVSIDGKAMSGSFSHHEHDDDHGHDH